MPSISTGQIYVCTQFEAEHNNLFVDTSGIWEIGLPQTATFDSSYSGSNSIVTSLNSNYPVNDTSTFNFVYKPEIGSIPDFILLGASFSIQFYHRFVTDSITDFGFIEMSLDHGQTWYDVLSSEHNLSDFTFGYIGNEHFFEGTQETKFDSLNVYGNSNGWVFSKFSKNVWPLAEDILPVDSIILKFGFVSDGIGGNEGWQIDDLCVFMDPIICLLYTSPSPRDRQKSRMPSSA